MWTLRSALAARSAHPRSVAAGVAVGAALTAALSLLVVDVMAGGQPAGAVRSGIGTVAPYYYVAVGASEAVGFEPVPGRRHGAPSDHGYANDVVRLESARWPGLGLIELGCPGITSVAALTGKVPSAPGESSAGALGRCTYPDGSEVATAVALIRQRRARTVLVTVDLGFNDIWPCLRHDFLDRGCVDTALRQIHQTLPVIIARLRAAGGSKMLIVGLEHSDPYLAEALRGRVAFARTSELVLHDLNDELAAIYLGAGALVADVPAAYGTGDRARTKLEGHGTVRKELARICKLTWMCGREHNLHPTNAGYRAIADAVAASIATAPVFGS